MFYRGESVPYFIAATNNNPLYNFSTIGGMYVVLCFFGSAGNAFSKNVIEGLQKHQDIFDTRQAILFGVSTDPQDRLYVS